jgi:hypothetical protein
LAFRTPPDRVNPHFPSDIGSVNEVVSDFPILAAMREVTLQSELAEIVRNEGLWNSFLRAT